MSDTRRSPGRSFAGLAIEGLLIVVSILLAFALEAWWAAQQEIATELELLRQLESEVAANAVELDRLRGRHEGVTNALTELLALSGPSAIPAIPNDSIARLVETATWTWTYDPGTGVLASLLASGQLALIRNDSLRAQLAAWPALVADVQENEGAAWSVMDSRITPFLDERLAWRTLNDAARDGYEPGPSGFDHDLVGLLRDREFENIVAGRLALEGAILAEYQLLERSLEWQLRAIRSELGS